MLRKQAFHPRQLRHYQRQVPKEQKETTPSPASLLTTSFTPFHLPLPYPKPESSPPISPCGEASCSSPQPSTIDAVADSTPHSAAPLPLPLPPSTTSTATSPSPSTTTAGNPGIAASDDTLSNISNTSNAHSASSSPAPTATIETTTTVATNAPTDLDATQRTHTPVSTSTASVTPSTATTSNPRRRHSNRSGAARLNTLRPTRQVLGRRRRSTADEDEQDIAEAQIRAEAEARADEEQEEEPEQAQGAAGQEQTDGNQDGNNNESTIRPTSSHRRRSARSSKRARTEDSSATMLASNDSQSQQNAMNGSSLLQNGKSKASTRRTAASSSSASASTPQPQAARRSSSYYGHDREEITRLIIQALSDLGYDDAAKNVSENSGYALESPAVADFRRAVLGGDWNEAERLLLGATTEPADGADSPLGAGVANGSQAAGTAGSVPARTTSSPSNGQTSVSANGSSSGLLLIPGTNRDLMRFGIRQQKYLEYLEQSDTAKALLVLRNELTPLYRDTQKLHFLSSLLMCHSPMDLMARATWDGAKGQSRPHLLSELSRYISPSVMLPDHRLAVLLRQIKDFQVAGCIFHTSATSPSLYADHQCDKADFPYNVLKSINPDPTGDSEVWQIRFSNNGKLLACCGMDRYVKIYDTSNFELKMPLDGHTGGVGDIAWSPDDRTLLSCDREGYARLWDMNTGLLVRLYEKFDEPISCCAWANDGQSIVLGSFDKERSLVQWSTGGQRLHTYTRKHRTEALALSPDGYWLVAMDHEKHIHVYNFITTELAYDLELDSRAVSIAISSDSQYLLVNRQDGQIHMYNIRVRGDPTRKYIGATGGSYIIRCAFGGADESFVVSGSEDGHVYIWHKNHGFLLFKLEAHQPRCNAVAWSPTDPSLFATCGDDGIIKIWSNAERARLAQAERDHTNGNSHDAGMYA